LTDFGIPRCYKPKDFGTVTRAELHHFSDASQEHGYKAVSYLRLTNERGEINCAFVLGKYRVRPLKAATTVPKLELTAATLLILFGSAKSPKRQSRFESRQQRQSCQA